MTGNVICYPRPHVNGASGRVLCVDLDGTLIATDLLWESFLSTLRARPWVLALAPLWLLAGRSYVKRRLARLASIDVATLPYRADVVQFVADERRRGRPVVLATASDSLLAERISQHLGFFDEVLASDGITNLKGRTKARSLVERFGRGNFDYLGDSRSDVHCWADAANAMTVGAEIPTAIGGSRYLPASKPTLIHQLVVVASVLRPH
jgi:phosphoserine phosphatase